MGTIKDWLQKLLNSKEESKLPFKSEDQKKFLFANKPKIAKEFAAKTPKSKKLPKKVKSIKGKK